MLRIIAGRHRNRPLRTPKGSSTRPTTSRNRETLFNICQQDIEGARVLDLYSGSGAIGIEALSRGAHEVIFVERDRGAANCIRENLEKLDESAEVLMMDVLKFLRRTDREGFNIIYADPPYETKTDDGYLCDSIARLVDAGQWLLPNGRLFIEESKQVTAATQSFEHIALERSRPMGRTQLLQYRSLKELS